MIEVRELIQTEERIIQLKMLAVLREYAGTHFPDGIIFEVGKISDTSFIPPVQSSFFTITNSHHTLNGEITYHDGYGFITIVPFQDGFPPYTNDPQLAKEISEG